MGDGTFEDGVSDSPDTTAVEYEGVYEEDAEMEPTDLGRALAAVS